MIKLLLASGIIFLVHLPDRHDLDGWVQGLKNSSGIPCCENSEAHALNEPDWRVNSEGHYEVFIDNEWADVPDSAVVQGPNKYGRVLVWYTHSPGFPIYVRCFLPAAGA
jgi:hypothetical protein